MKTTGLNVYPRTSADATTMGQVIENSEFSAEYNTEFGCYFFEEDEENYDDLEDSLTDLFNESGLSHYRIEGIF